MVAPAIGQVVLISFPFSDLAGAKLRPAVVLADAVRDIVEAVVSLLRMGIEA
jgi:mRNA interferase MazF